MNQATKNVDQSHPLELVELDAGQLRLVSGGLPKGTWIDGVQLPKGTWQRADETQLPKGTW